MTALGSSGWRGRSLLDVTRRRGYRSRGRTARDTPKAMVSSVQAWENGRAGKRANAPRPLATPTSTKEVPGMTRHDLTNPTAEQTLTQAAQQMAMARPWDHAEPESLWVITGAYPGGKGTFTSCLAMTLPSYVTGCESPLFQKVGAWGLVDASEIPPAWITHAEPLLIVMRDEPTTPFWEEDRVWLP